MLIAYIDPAIGSMVLQAMAGLILAGIVMGRRILAAPFKWLRLKRSPYDPDSDLPE